MKVAFLVSAFGIAVFVAGCLTAPVSESGGPGAVTAQNTNVTAITTAAQTVFAQSGYTPGPANYPTWIAFDKPAGRFGNILWNSYGQTTTIRVRLLMTELASTSNYRLSVRVYRVSNAGETGFEDTTRMAGLWQDEFEPLLKKIAAKAGGAGPLM
jgi:hypothetical protein